jgi:hypothetical protein
MVDEFIPPKIKLADKSTAGSSAILYTPEETCSMHIQ